MVECENGINEAKNVKSDYEKRMLDCGKDEFLRLRTAEWLIDATQRIVKDVRDNNQQLLENALRNKAVSKKLTNLK